MSCRRRDSTSPLAHSRALAPRRVSSLPVALPFPRTCSARGYRSSPSSESNEKTGGKKNPCPPFFHLVPKGGLEPPRVAPPPPQDGASANSATSALRYPPFGAPAPLGAGRGGRGDYKRVNECESISWAEGPLRPPERSVPVEQPGPPEVQPFFQRQAGRSSRTRICIWRHGK